jgi:hypothetical protein
MAVADSGMEKEGGVAGWDRTGGSSFVWAGRRLTVLVFLVGASLLALLGLGIEA